MKDWNIGKVSESFDLNLLRLVDSSLSDKFKPSYEHVFNPKAGGGEIMGMGDKFLPVNGFLNPVVLGFEDGEMIFLWLDSEAILSSVTTALEFIM